MRVRSIFPAFTAAVAAILLITGCQRSSQPSGTRVSDLEYTQAVQTIAAELTQKAPKVTLPPVSGLIQTVTPQALVSTSTPEPSETLPATSTPRPTKTPWPTETFTPEYTATSTEPTATSEPDWTLVYQDELSSGTWISQKADKFRLQYSHGGYMISSAIEKDIAYSVRSDSFKDVRVEVSMERNDGPTDGYAGIICHFQNGGNYYFLGAGIDGWYGIGLKQGSQLRFLEEGYDKNGAVKPGNVVNNLRAECANGNLILWVNEIQLASARDLTFDSGSIGVGVGNRSATGMEVVFSDFMVYEIVQAE
jgi:hypothetical protein